MLFSLAEIKIVQFNHGLFKSINQSESSINYKEIFIFSDINQPESSINYMELFIFSDINQSELSFNSHVIFDKLMSTNQN